MRTRFSNIVSVVALVVALTSAGAYAKQVFISGGQIKNNTVTSKDLRNNGVQALDLATGSVESKELDTEAVESSDIENSAINTEDIGTNQVTTSDVNLPDPTQIVEAPQAGVPVGPEFGLIEVVGSYTEPVLNESVVAVDWSGAVSSGSGTNCVFQLRVNGQPATDGGGEVFALDTPLNVATTALFEGLPVGPSQIEIWAKYSAKVSGGPSCIVGPSYPGIQTTVVVSQIVQ